MSLLTIETLPSDVLDEVLSRVPLKCVGRFAQASRKCFAATLRGSMWRLLILRMLEGGLVARKMPFESVDNVMKWLSSLKEHKDASGNVWKDLVLHNINGFCHPISRFDSPKETTVMRLDTDKFDLLIDHAEFSKKFKDIIYVINECRNLSTFGIFGFIKSISLDSQADFTEIRGMCQDFRGDLVYVLMNTSNLFQNPIVSVYNSELEHVRTFKLFENVDADNKRYVSMCVLGSDSFDLIYISVQTDASSTMRLLEYTNKGVFLSERILRKVSCTNAKMAAGPNQIIYFLGLGNEYELHAYDTSKDHLSLILRFPESGFIGVPIDILVAGTGEIIISLTFGHACIFNPVAKSIKKFSKYPIKVLVDVSIFTGDLLGFSSKGSFLEMKAARLV